MKLKFIFLKSPGTRSDAAAAAFPGHRSLGAALGLAEAG